MALSSFLQQPAPISAPEFADQAVQQQQRQALVNTQIQSAQEEQASKRRSMAVSLLNGIANEQDPAKQVALYGTLRPMAERYDPTLKLPDGYDPSTIKALVASQIPAKDMFAAQKPDLPQGYRMNASTGQAELVPGVDPSFGKKADPFGMPMPVQTADGTVTFATKREVVNNPADYKPAPQPGGDFNRENSLRDEFNTLTKDFRTVQDAYTKISSTSDTGAGDMSMLYAYVKLLDPGSVVRESEFATAAASGSFGERVQGAVKSLISGGRLSPELRRQFQDEAGRIYGGQKTGYDRIKTNYTDIASRNNLKPENVITDYAQPASGQVPAGLPPEAKQAPDGNYYVPDPNRPGKYLMVQP